MTIDDIDRTGPDDDELFAGLPRSVAGATLSTAYADVEAMGRRTRRRHRAVQAGIGTSTAALVAAVALLAPETGTGPGTGPGTASARGATTATGPRLAPGQTLDIQDAGFSLTAQGDGKISLSLRDMFDPDKLQGALASIGIASRVERITVPAGWDLSKPYCKPTKPQQFFDPDAIGAFSSPSQPGASPSDHVITIDATRLPAGDVFFLSVVTFAGSGEQNSGMAVFKQDPGPCIPASKSVKVQ